MSSFLADYFSTPDSWSVKTSVDRVIRATNSWLYAQTQQSQSRVDKDRGYVCTFSALVFKHETVHLFHIGDARIYRLREQQLEQLSVDHRVWLSSRESYLSRALGVAQKVEVDYLSLPLAQDDIFLLMTDGVYEYLSDSQIIEALHSPETLDLDQVAEMLVHLADAQGSPDNLTLQIVQVQQLPQHAAALGTLAFMAPEYFCSRPVSTRSDQFSLAVVLYYVLSKQLPYGTELARCQTLKQLKTVRYHSILEYRPDIPVWIDGALHKALALMPNERYEVLSEFLYDLKHPNRYFLKPVQSSLLDKNPVRFWQAVSAMLFLCLLLSLALMFSV